MDKSAVQPSDMPEEGRHRPLSSAQLRVWFMEQLAEGTAANNLFFGLRLSGELDTAALDLALRLVVERHEVLRTTFDMRNGEPVQVLHRTRPSVRVIDLGERSASEAEKEAYIVARREIYTPFDLREDLPVRLLLLRLGPDNHIMLAVLHHIVCDNWSLGLFARELEQCYGAFCSGAKPGLKSTLQYADYIDWQRNWLGSQDFERQLSYWTAKLAGSRSGFDLSTDRMRPAERSFTGSSQARRLSRDLTRRTRAVARRHNATPFAVSLAALQVLLCQYSDETDVLVGIPVAGRGSVEWEEIIGNFANLVVVRSDLSGDPSFVLLLRGVREAILDALANQDVPFERLVEALNPSRNLAHNPIFQVLFASVKTAAPRDRFAGLAASPYLVETMAVPFDLSISLVEDSPDVWWLRAEYRTDLFAHDWITGLLDHYILLLDSAVARPQARLSQLPRPSHRSVARDAGTGGRDTAPGRPDLTPEHPAGAGSVEETLQRLWAEVLRIGLPEITANFFDLGGHSLLAVRLVSEIGRVFRTKLPVSFVFQAPTIAAMARHLRGENGATSSVVPLHAGGTRPPFFCGGPMRREFQELSRTLGREQPFYQLDIFTLQAQREFSGEPLYRSVPDLAASFRQDILSIQPYGPYFLGGMCEGGIVAFEIALQLQEQGHRVALLAEFDTPSKGYWRRPPVQWLRFGYWLIASGGLPSQIRDRFAARRGRRHPASPEEERLFRIQRVIWEAIRAYRPKRVFDGEIQFFRARNPPDWFVEDALAGWDARASRGVRVHQLACEHLLLLCDLPSQRVIGRVIEQAYHASVTG